MDYQQKLEKSLLKQLKNTKNVKIITFLISAEAGRPIFCDFDAIVSLDIGTHIEVKGKVPFNLLDNEFISFLEG